MTDPRAPSGSDLPAVLCVDDEPAVLDGLRRQLHQDVAVTGVTSGEEALELMDEREPAFAAVVCDMRMPGLDGVAVLAGARQRRPDTVRLLLTGHADLDSAVAAVNDGNIFRFLVKPCASAVLRRALSDAIGLHRSLTAERELLEQTLRGAVAALADALALANPTAFARATRIQALVRSLIAALDPPDAWRIEVAAMLSQIGTVVLAPGTVAKLHDGRPLNEDERAQVQDLPRLAERVLAPIPRLEDVRRIIRDQHRAFAHHRHGPDGPEPTSLGARMLRVAADLDTLEAGGVSRRDALAALAAEPGVYDPVLLELLAPRPEPAGTPTVHALEVQELRAGHTIAQDVLDGEGRLVIGRGYAVTESLVERLSNWRGPALREPIFVFAGTA